MTEKKPLIRQDHLLHLVISFMATLAILSIFPVVMATFGMVIFFALTIVWEFRGTFEWTDILANIAGMTIAILAVLGLE